VGERDLSRVVAFSDGVMAVAITLLVLNLEVPEVTGEDLEDALADLVPSLGAYLLAFALIGRFWVLHHNLFERLRGFDATVMALNLLFLALIALLPFSTDLYDEYTDEGLAAAVLGATLGLAAVLNWAMTAYALRRDFVHERHRAATAPFARPAGLVLAAAFILSVPLAFVNVHIAEAVWISTIVFRYPLRRLRGRTSSA
jgi:uncharacterized membrane protein